MPSRSDHRPAPLPAPAVRVPLLRGLALPAGLLILLSYSSRVRWPLSLPGGFFAVALGTAEPLPATQRLADLYEGPLDDDARAISALKRWATLSPHDAQPLRRLRAQYQHAEQLPEFWTD